MSIKFAIKSHYEDSGTDIYVKKIDPGAGYGSGYTVEIYDYGQKIDEIKVNTKKEVLDIIREQKQRYNTDRAFENESHLFISYKVDDIESAKFRKQQGIQVKESTMTNLDKQLYKKASRINYLLSASKYPEIPKKFIRYGEEILNFEEPSYENNVDLNTLGITAETTEDELITAIKDTLISYFSNTSDAIDQQYNNTKRWLSKVMKEIVNKANSEYNLNFNLDSIADKLTAIFSNSELPGEEILFKSAKDITRMKTAENAPSNFIGTTMTADTGQVSNMSNVVMNNQAINNSNSIINKQPLSIEAKNLIDRVETIKDNPYEVFNVVKTTNNSDALITEIKDNGEGTEAEYLIVNSKLSALEHIVKKVDENFSNFLRYAQIKRGKTSFNATYAQWRKSNDFTPFMDELLDLKRSLTIHSIQNGREANDIPLKIYASFRLSINDAIQRHANEGIDLNPTGHSFTYERALNLDITGEFVDVIWEGASRVRNVSPSKYKETAERLYREISATGILARFIKSLLGYSVVTEHYINAQSTLSLQGITQEVANNLPQLLIDNGLKAEGAKNGVNIFIDIYEKLCTVLAEQLASVEVITNNEKSKKFIEMYFNYIKQPKIYETFTKDEITLDNFFNKGVAKAIQFMGVANIANRQGSFLSKKAVNIIINEAGAPNESIELGEEGTGVDEGLVEDKELEDVLGIPEPELSEESTQEVEENEDGDELSSLDNIFDATKESNNAEALSSDNDKKLIDMIRED